MEYGILSNLRGLSKCYAGKWGIAPSSRLEMRVNWANLAPARFLLSTHWGGGLQHWALLKTLALCLKTAAYALTTPTGWLFKISATIYHSKQPVHFFGRFFFFVLVENHFRQVKLREKQKRKVKWPQNAPFKSKLAIIHVNVSQTCQFYTEFYSKIRFYQHKWQ